jgi:hypothetical protein
MSVRFIFLILLAGFFGRLKAQAPGNNLFMQYYAGKNFEQRTFLMDRMLFSTDLSKDFVFHSSLYLHDVVASMDVTNPTPYFKENMALLNTYFVSDYK